MKKNEDAVARRRPKTSAAQIRVQKGKDHLQCWERLSAISRAGELDLTELDLPPTMKTFFPDTNDLLNFNLIIEPDEGARLNG